MFMPSLVVIHSLVLEKNADKQTNKLFSNFSMIRNEKNAIIKKNTKQKKEKIRGTLLLFSN